jgi:hypothetical protein
VPDLSPFEAEIAIAKLKKYKSPGSDQIPEEIIQAGSETLLSAIHKLINSIWNKEEFPDQWKECIIVPIHKKGDKTDCKYLSWDVIANGLKQGNALLTTLFNSALDMLLGRSRKTRWD